MWIHRCILAGFLGWRVSASAHDATIRIDASAERHRVSRLLTGACIEDVNHEIYGGLYSQMIFGESFQEPAAASPVASVLIFDDPGPYSLERGTVGLRQFHESTSYRNLVIETHGQTTPRGCKRDWGGIGALPSGACIAPE